jgi:hypothetical protein
VYLTEDGAVAGAVNNFRFNETPVGMLLRWPRPGRPGGRGPSTNTPGRRAENGRCLLGDKSWSIDMQWHNFQFTGQRLFRIRDDSSTASSRTSPG